MLKIVSLLLFILLSSSTLFAECDMDLLYDIQTELKEDRKIVEKLTVCKKWPYKDELSIFVMTFPNVGTTDENLEDDLADYDVHTIIYNTNKKVIENHLYQEKLYSSDAVRLDHLKIDTARYNLNKDTRAFGINAVYYGSSRVNPYDVTSLDLYIRDKKSLRKVLETVIVENGGEWDGVCNGDFYYQSSIVLIDKSKRNGFYNLKLKRTSMDNHIVLKDKICKENESPKRYEYLPFIYDGQSYKVNK